MIHVKYPAPVFRFKEENGKEMIFDFIRKQWLQLNEEEWVRQNFIQFLVQEVKYPLELIAVEKEIQLGDLKKRFDILVYDRNHKPWMLIECKAGEITLDKKALYQVLRYNISMPATFLVITNGHFTYAWEKTNGELKEIQQMPLWK
ncbi:MAG TPA: type I restriction enzyme HsdR N-terminal domain-containing protein [Chitinophagaceae bacterium]|nr:type I restriction enzyme HsdR N-terminal domain-containing protein [Chitinophagaceae bacterium]